MDPEYDRGPQASANYPGRYRPHQSATPRKTFSTPDLNRAPQHPARYLEARRYGTRQYGATGYAQAQDDSPRNPTPRNIHYSERLNPTRHNQRRQYGMTLEAPFHLAPSPTLSQPALIHPAPALYQPKPPMHPVLVARIYLRSIQLKSPHSIRKVLWSLDTRPDRYPRQMRAWADLEFTLELSLEKDHCGVITGKSLYLHCTPRSSSDGACLRFDLCPRRQVGLGKGRGESLVSLHVHSPGVPSGTESTEEEDSWRTILKDLHLMLLQDGGLPSVLTIGLDDADDSKAIESFLQKARPTQNGSVNGGTPSTGGASGVEPKFSISGDAEIAGEPRADSDAGTTEEPRADDGAEIAEEPRRKKKKKYVVLEAERKAPVAGSDTETSGQPRQKRKRSPPSDTETPEQPRRKKKKKKKLLTSGPERKIPVEGGAEGPGGSRHRKKTRPSQLDSSEEPLRKKKKSWASEPERRIPIVLSDSETAEEPRRKKKKPRPSEPEPARVVKKSKEDKAGPTHKRSKGKNKQSPPSSPPSSPPRSSTPVSNDTNLDALQKRLAEINQVKSELFVEEQELKAKLARQRYIISKQSGSSDGKVLRHYTCSACGEYGHRRDSWKCEKNPGRKKVLSV